MLEKDNGRTKILVILSKIDKFAAKIWAENFLLSRFLEPG
jgi:hypothetical protein